MAQDTVTEADTQETPQRPRPVHSRPVHGRSVHGRPERGRAHKIGRWTLVVIMVLSLMVGGAIMAVVGQRLSAPDWLRARIEARIEQSLGGMQIEFGGVSVVINKGWRPRVRLRDVVLLDADGQLVAQLAEAQAALAMRPLLRGQVQPKQILLNGALATLRRDRDGKLSLSVGASTAPVEQAANLPQLIEQWDQLFLKPQLAALASVEIEALSLRYEDAQKGRAWTLDGGSIRMDRDNKDLLTMSAVFSLLSGRDYASVIEMNYASRVGDARAEFGMAVQDIAAQDIAAQSVALGWLDILRAPISGALRGEVEEDGSLAPLSATLQIGAGVLQPIDQTRPIPFSGARSYFTYAPDLQLLSFDELSMSSEQGSFMAEGQVWLGDIENGTLSDLTGQITLSSLSLNPDDIYPEPLVLDGAEADIRLELDPFRLTLGQMHVADKGGNLQVSGTLDAAPDGWHLALDAQIDRMETDRLITLWPEVAARKPRKWVTNNLLGGIARDGNFSLRADPGQKPVIHAGFGFEDATIRFLKTMPPITGADGLATLSEGRFVVTATTGEVVADEGGAIDISGTSFIIPDVTIKKAAPGVVRLAGQGPITAVLSLLNRPPLQVLKDTPLPVDVANGQAQISGTLALPLKDRVQLDEMEFHFTGSVVDVSSDKLVPGFSLTAPVMQVIGDQTGLVLSGKGHIGPVPVEVAWHRPIGKDVGKESRLTGEIELSQKAVDTFGIGLPKGSVSGQGQGQFTLDLVPGKAPSLALTSDLAGVGLRLAPLGWSKSERSTGLLELAGSLGEKTSIDRLVLKADGLTATGSVLNRPGGGLDRALFSSVRMGGWLDAQVELVGRGDNAPPDLRILSGMLDMRRTDFGTSTGGTESAAQTGPMQVSLNRLQVTDTIALTDFKGTFNTSGGLNGVYTGRLNGQTEVEGNLVPRNGGSAVLVESKDAGGIFRDAGLLTKARGGSFKLSLLPVVGKPGQYDGTMHVKNTKVKDAPAIAALLNAVSVVGLIDEMAGQGINFLEVDAKFRLGPSKLVLYQSSAVGPSIGLSMDGLYDVPSGVLDMQGVISPVYLLNSIGSVLTRKGEGVIGFSYKLTGTSDDPNVLVNPLSGLAPGMLRDVFRGAPPTPDDGKNTGGRKTDTKTPLAGDR